MDEKVIPLQPPTGLAGYGPPALQPSLGRWQGLTYAGPSGSRSYFVYTPAGYTTDRCVAMVVMLHGCTQTAAESAAGTQWNPLADAHEFVVVYPQQGDADNALSCWNWFVPEHQERGSGEAAIIAGITGQVMTNDTRWNIDPGRVYIAGLSAGAAISTILAATYPDLYVAARGPHRPGVPGRHRGTRRGGSHEERRPRPRRAGRQGDEWFRLCPGLLVGGHVE